MPLSPERLAQAARYLEQHEEAQRIQKLIFCLCKKYWENDPNILNSISFDQLVQELIQTRPTMEKLNFSLYKLVKTLNRPKVYAGMAKVVLDQLGPIYRDAEEEAKANIIDVDVKSQESETQFGLSPAIAVQETVLDVNILAERVAQNLARQAEQERIKKLMFAVDRGYWENDLKAIENYGFTQLVADLRQTFPTKDDLRRGFKDIVQNINKSTLYLGITDVILKQMDCLYQELAAGGRDNPDIVAPHLPSAIVRTSSPPSGQRVAPAQEVTAIVGVKPAGRNAAGVTVLETPAALKRLVPEDYNLFELRLSIMQNTNPLRAKILLFSIRFHTWDNSAQDWSMLRSYGLDDLLEQVILCGKPLAAIEEEIYEKASLLDEAETYAQTASAIVQVLKSIFPSW